jgi:hypothetical protein
MTSMLALTPAIAERIFNIQNNFRIVFGKEWKPQYKKQDYRVVCRCTPDKVDPYCPLHTD